MRVAEPSEQYRIGRPRSCQCGTCHKCKRADYMRQWWRSKPIEHRRRLVSGRDPEAVRRSEQRRSKKRLGDPIYKEREQARMATRAAIKRGSIVRRPCERCGDANSHAHHEDYSRPMDVMWLCPEHHAQRHIERAEEQGIV